MIEKLTKEIDGSIKILILLYVIIIAPTYYIDLSNVVDKLHGYHWLANYFISAELESKLNNYIYPMLNVLAGPLAIIGIFKCAKTCNVIISMYYLSHFLTSVCFGVYQIVNKNYDHNFSYEYTRFFAILGIILNSYYVLVAILLLLSLFVCKKNSDCKILHD